ncbi:hypothetical protein V8F20_005746 [Naviculisporaceae sp. PSN 640]
MNKGAIQPQSSPSGFDVPAGDRTTPCKTRWSQRSTDRFPGEGGRRRPKEGQDRKQRCGAAITASPFAHLRAACEHETETRRLAAGLSQVSEWSKSRQAHSSTCRYGLLAHGFPPFRHSFFAFPHQSSFLSVISSTPAFKVQHNDRDTAYYVLRTERILCMCFQPVRPVADTPSSRITKPTPVRGLLGHSHDRRHCISSIDSHSLAH